MQKETGPLSFGGLDDYLHLGNFTWSAYHPTNTKKYVCIACRCLKPIATWFEENTSSDRDKHVYKDINIWIHITGLTWGAPNWSKRWTANGCFVSKWETAWKPISRVNHSVFENAICARLWEWHLGEYDHCPFQPLWNVSFLQIRLIWEMREYHIIVFQSSRFYSRLYMATGLNVEKHCDFHFPSWSATLRTGPAVAELVACNEKQICRRRGVVLYFPVASNIPS